MTCNKSQFFLWRCFNIKQELPINGQIREKEVQLIGANGEKLGIISTREALDKAAEQNLDLVLVAPNSKPVVCKIMNYGKYKFEQAKKEKEAKKKQREQNLELKEYRLSVTIDTHDFDTKVRNASKYLEKGNKVKASIRFKGRQLAHPELGRDVIMKFASKLDDVAVIEQMPKLEGRSMQLFLAPKK